MFQRTIPSDIFKKNNYLESQDVRMQDQHVIVNTLFLKKPQLLTRMFLIKVIMSSHVDLRVFNLFEHRCFEE